MVKAAKLLIKCIKTQYKTLFSLYITNVNNSPNNKGYIVWEIDIWYTANIVVVITMEKVLPCCLRPLNISPLNSNSSTTAGMRAEVNNEIK